MSASYLLERAWVDGAVRDDVLVTIEDSRFTSVTPDWHSLHMSGSAPADKRMNPRPTGDSDRVPGLTIPGLANCHSHAFHRALRGRAQPGKGQGSGTFWTWREQMYAVAARLDPDSYHRLARATFREMAAAGITGVGEFHYLHHQPDGTPYDDPNAMGHAVIAAAREAGIRIALLDTCYLTAGFGQPTDGVQTRFDDGDAEHWAERVSGLDPSTWLRTGKLDHRGQDVVIGAAIHSVRAVPAEQMHTVVEWSRPFDLAQDRQVVPELSRRARPPGGAPLHVHLSEQTAENDACIAAYGATPTQLLADHGVLGPRTTAVHATHLTDDDLDHLGSTGTYACFCPTTERDLADGVGPSRRLRDAGARLTLGSDSHAVIDLFEEMRAVELDERLVTRERGHWSSAELLEAATTTGHQSLGFADAGAIAVGHRADLVTLDTASPRTAGTGRDEQTAVFAATAAEVTQVMVDGRVVVRAGDREEIGRELDEAIAELWR